MARLQQTEQERLLATFQPDEPVELAQELIRIPSFLWRESEVGNSQSDVNEATQKRVRVPRKALASAPP